jgi:ssDNA thymidine ADP-ribosyltransferase DarT-like protein
MYQVPAQPKIYHILHVDRLASVLAVGGLWCDAQIQRQGGAGTTIGMSRIKQRRLSLPVKCHPGDNVGDYVPFYFCSRSIMLYLIHMANHVELTYRGGQGPIIHLQADLNATVAWADAQRRRWAFSLSNAGAYYTEFRSQMNQLSDINWPAVAANDFRSPDINEGKQAEFLLHNFFPWELVEQVGVYSQGIEQQAVQLLQARAHRPPVARQPAWYF